MSLCLRCVVLEPDFSNVLPQLQYQKGINGLMSYLYEPYSESQMTDFFVPLEYRHTLDGEVRKLLSALADGIQALAYYLEACRQYVGIGERGVPLPVSSGIWILHRVVPQRWPSLQ